MAVICSVPTVYDLRCSIDHPEAAVSGTGPDVDGLALLGGHTPRATEALNHQETVCRTMAIRRGLRAGQ